MTNKSLWIILIVIILIALGTSIYAWRVLRVKEEISPAMEKPSEEAGKLVDEVKVALIQIDGMNGIFFDEDTREKARKAGTLIGCGDIVVYVERKIEPTTQPLNAAYRELFTMGSEITHQGVTYSNQIAYHAKGREIYREDQPLIVVRPLRFVKAVIENDIAKVYLQGDYASVGTCEPPRTKAQLVFTARQFPWIHEVKIYIEGEEADFVHGGSDN